MDHHLTSVFDTFMWSALAYALGIKPLMATPEVRGDRVAYCLRALHTRYAPVDFRQCWIEHQYLIPPCGVFNRPVALIRGCEHTGRALRWYERGSSICSCSATANSASHCRGGKIVFIMALSCEQNGIWRRCARKASAKRNQW